MTTQPALLSPMTVLEQFKKNGVTHVVYLPDSETNHLFIAMENDPAIDVIPWLARPRLWQLRPG